MMLKHILQSLPILAGVSLMGNNVFSQTATEKKGADSIQIASKHVQQDLPPSYQPAPYTPDDPVLYKEIVRMDSILFHAYNECDLATLQTILADSLEFYHDKTGLSTSKTDVIESIHRYVCGKVVRVLVQGSIEVYPIAGYGAVEIGYHRFQNKAEHSLSRPGKFITIWRKNDNSWQVTRVISLH